MKIVNIGNIAEAYICDDLPAMGIVIEATLDELERLPNLVYKDVTISATPRRNCDVGSAEEQYKRFMNMCNSKDVRQCAECSMRGFTPGCSRDRCFANWAQMPYEEGGAK